MNECTIDISLRSFPAERLTLLQKAIKGQTVEEQPERAAPTREERPGRVPQKSVTSGHRLLESAPDALVNLSQWFREITPEQVDAVWVAAIVQAVEADDVQIGIRSLSEALVTARDIARDSVAGPSESPQEIKPKSGRKVVAIRRRNPLGIPTPDPESATGRVHERMLQLLPTVGSVITVREHFASEVDRSLANQLANRDPRFHWLGGRPAKCERVPYNGETTAHAQREPQ